MNTRLLTIILAGCLAAGCAKQNGASIETVGFCAYTSSGPECGPSGSCSKYLTGIDTFYLLNSATVLNGPLGYFVEVQNQVAASDAAGGGALNTHDAYVEGSSISYQVDVSQSLSTPPFSLPDDEAGTIETRIPAGGGTNTPWLTVLPPATLIRLADRIDTDDSVLLTIDVSPKVRFQDGSKKSNVAPVRYWVEVVNSVFGGYSCPKAGEVVTDMCGVYGDMAVNVKCENGTATTYAIGGAVAGLGGGTNLTITCTINGTSNDLPVMAGPGNYTCGSAALGSTYSIDLSSSGGTQSCTFDSTSGATSVSGTVGAAAVAEAITCS